MGKERSKHKTQKPLKVCVPYLELSSNPMDLVLDPFMGSGTTAVASKKLNRDFIGFELSEEYIEITKERLAAVEVGELL